MRSVLITGIGGFIGSSLAVRLASRGYKVTGIDSLSDYYSPETKKSRIQLLETMGIQVQIRDMLEMNLKELFHRGQFQTCFHLAGRPGVQASWKDFDVYIRENVLLTNEIARAICESESKTRLIFASSSSVYGMSQEQKLSEGDILQPVSPYGVSKKSAEDLLFSYHKNFNLEYIAARFFTVYGPGQRPDMAFSKFIKSIREDHSIRIHGDGKQSRDFTHVDDLLEALLLLEELELGNGKLTVNIGSGSPVRLLEAVATIGKIMGKKPNLDFVEDVPGNPKSTWASNEFLTAQGWRPKVSLEQGLRSQIEHS